MIQLQDEVLCVLEELMTDADLRPSLEAAVANLLKEEHKTRTCYDASKGAASTWRAGLSRKQVCLDMLSVPDTWLRFLLSTVFLGHSMSCIELPEAAEHDKEMLDKSLNASDFLGAISRDYSRTSLIRPELVHTQEGAVSVELFNVRLALAAAAAYRRCMQAFRIDRAKARPERTARLVQCAMAWGKEDPTMEHDQPLRLRAINEMNVLLEAQNQHYTSLPVLDAALVGKCVTFQSAAVGLHLDLQSLQGVVIGMDAYLGVYVVELESGDVLVARPEAVALPRGFPRLLVCVATVGLAIGILLAYRRFRK